MYSFNCSPFGIIGVSPNLYGIDLYSGSTSALGKITPSNNGINAFGYNRTDGFIYGFNTTTLHVFKLGADLQLVDLATIPNFDTTIPWRVGDVDMNGYLYMCTGNTLELTVVDVNPSRATYGQIVDPATKAVTTTISWLSAVPPRTFVGTGDWAFHPTDGYLYFTASYNGLVNRVDPLTGVMTPLPTTNSVIGNYSSAFFDNKGNLYALDITSLPTATTRKYVISGSTVTASYFSTSTIVGSADGARCADAPIRFAYFTPTIPKTATPLVAVGETISYTLVLNNAGNLTANNVFLYDTIPNGTSFVANSLMVNGVTFSGSPAPPSGIGLGDLALGLNTITYVVIATTIPTPNPTLNTATLSYEFTDPTDNTVYQGSTQSTIVPTTIIDLGITPVKSVNKQHVALGDTITYSIALIPSGNTSSLTTVFIDTVPNGTTFVAGSLKQDSTTLSGSPNFPGVTLPNTLSPGIVSTITYSVMVTTIPTPNPIPNTSSLWYSFTGKALQSNTTSSNTTFTTLHYVDLFPIVKTVDKDYTTCGDTLTYTFAFKNSGNATATNVILQDTLSAGLVYINNTMTINGVPSTDSPTSITISTIAPNQAMTISFQVQVTCL